MYTERCYRHVRVLLEVMVYVTCLSIGVGSARVGILYPVDLYTEYFSGTAHAL